MVNCKVCEAEAEYLGEVNSLRVCSDDNLYPLGHSSKTVSYYLCPSCGFIFTPDFDSATGEWWQQNIYNSDYYQVVDLDYKTVRPKRQADLLSFALASLKGFLDALDWGGGTVKQQGLCATTVLSMFQMILMALKNVLAMTRKKSILYLFLRFSSTIRPLGILFVRLPNARQMKGL